MAFEEPDRLGPKQFRVWVILKLEKILEEVRSIRSVCAVREKRIGEIENFTARQRALRPFLIGIFTTLGAVIGAAAASIIRIAIGGIE